MSGEKTETKKLAEEYIRLGGKRQSIMDDNLVDTRKWENDNPEAEAFWNENIKTLDDDRLREVQTYLPSINSD
ncbi:hypothetical protein EPK99_10295 [Neorhizobium lilium]|uniref:Uncharacterized protein n=1 Tax=Neorhizobium lilium TaxID=2503024 RepID=A0A444LIT9_9HYPH|nr:hypothetical protein [Neorhizobium lilium]RWX78956.1 hypothetical protein EPK99_10295 [Neorhizobium lilium]